MKTLTHIILFLSLSIGLAHAKPMAADLVDVPVDRLLANVQSQLAKHPDDAHLHYALARIHAIAYAQAASKIQVDRNRGDALPGSRELPPWNVVKSASAARQAHLKAAMDEYARAMKLDASDPAPALGLGWCQVQAGRKAEARATLLAAYDRAIKLEKNQKSWAPFQPCMACEAFKYLQALLDPTKDTATIQKMKAETARLETLPRAVTPIVIPLEDAAFDQLVDRHAAVPFDLDASGQERRWQWITPRAAWLVYVGSGERAPSDGTRLLGARTFWVFWTDGYDALSSFDADGDGWLRGAELDGLGVWHDANMNGVVDRGEVLTLGQIGVIGLGCKAERHAEGFPYCPGGVLFEGGKVRDTYDWIARTRK